MLGPKGIVVSKIHSTLEQIIEMLQNLEIEK